MAELATQREAAKAKAMAARAVQAEAAIEEGDSD
jgi:hypothetical protein